MALMDGDDVTLYGHWICPFATRVEFALHQRGIAHDFFELPPSAVRPADFVLPPEFLEHSPRREIPMVRVGDAFLTDSIPILLWLEAIRPEPGLLPEESDARARVLERIEWLDEHVMRPVGGVYYGTEPRRIAHAAEALAASLEHAAAWLEVDDWLAGPVPTLAEAIMVPVYVRLDALEPLGFRGPIPPAIDQHRARCRELPGWGPVEWTPSEQDEFIGRFRKHRELARRR